MPERGTFTGSEEEEKEKRLEKKQERLGFYEKREHKAMVKVDVYKYVTNIRAQRRSQDD